MKVTGTLINYYFHCKRQCYLFGNRICLEDNSEDVKIGKAIHELKDDNDNTEIFIENIRIDKITKDYLVEIKKSDADVEATKWQTLYYLKVLKDKGIIRRGKIEFIEKNKTDRKIIYLELTDKEEQEIEDICINIQNIIEGNEIPSINKKAGCKKCSYYEYCYI